MFIVKSYNRTTGAVLPRDKKGRFQESGPINYARRGRLRQTELNQVDGVVGVHRGQSVFDRD
jgi:hypothetical protein